MYALIETHSQTGYQLGTVVKCYHSLAVASEECKKWQAKHGKRYCGHFATIWRVVGKRKVDHGTVVPFGGEVFVELTTDEYEQWREVMIGRRSVHRPDTNSPQFKKFMEASMAYKARLRDARDERLRKQAEASKQMELAFD